SLADVVMGETISLETFAKNKALLVMFVCQHCPYVQHIKKEIARIGKDYEDKNLGVVAISSNDASSYPDDSPQNLKEMAKELDLSFPLCFDETQEVAKAYTAACTPDFFLFDQERGLVYRGQLDDSRPGNNQPVTGGDLRLAIEAVLNDQPVNPEQKPSTGCNIKWKPGNGPYYF
ncbi:alkyl hydroperoxide reductase, partial [Candidatus Roizmanbacteria bacterium RIFCSPHIGHO2_12_FULL_36_11]